MSITDRIILEKENVRLAIENRQLKNEIQRLHKVCDDLCEANRKK